MSFYGILLVSVSMLAIISAAAIIKESDIASVVYLDFGGYANMLAVQSFKNMIVNTEPINMTSYQEWKDSIGNAALADGIVLNTNGNEFIIRSIGKPYVYTVIISNLSSSYGNRTLP